MLPRATSTATASRTSRPRLLRRRPQQHEHPLGAAQRRQRGFLAPLNGPIDREPIDIVTADFDDDGKLDVAEAALGIRQVAIYFGNGTGGFDTFGFTGGPSGGNVEALYAADFNGDGKPDLAVLDGLNNSVAALLNDGSGGFPQGGVIGYSALGRIFGVAAGDFNGDGKPDLAASTSNSVLVMNQTSSGGFRSPVAAVPAPVSVATADFDGDGKPDTATAGKGGATVVLNDGGGGFLEPLTTALAARTYRRYPSSRPTSLATASRTWSPPTATARSRWRATTAAATSPSRAATP